MRKMKKLGALLLVLAMCLSLGAPAFADEVHEYTITVKNAGNGKTYSAYKIFDATYSNGNVAYTISNSSAWYTIVCDGYKFTDDNGIEESVESPFSLKKTFSGSWIYTVTVKDGKNDQDIIDFFVGAGVPENAAAAVSASGQGGDLVLNVKEAGYYFVTTDAGSLVSITTAAPAVTIVDKSTLPGSLNKVIIDNDQTEGVHSDTKAIGDDVEFLITANVPLYDGSNLVTNYTFEDLMGDGLCIELGAGDVYVGEGTEKGDESGRYYLRKINDTGDDGICIDDWVTIGSGSNASLNLKLSDESFLGDYYLELTGVEKVYSDDGTTVVGYTATGFCLYYTTYDTTYEAAAGDSGADVPVGGYPADATIRIDYTAHVTAEAGYDNKNTVTMKWDETPFNNFNPDEPVYSGELESEDDIYVFSLTIQKKDAGDKETLLSGAEFTLEGSNLHDVVVSTTVTYTPVETRDQYVAEIEAGTVLYFKLDSGSYTTVNPYELNPENQGLSAYVETPDAPDDYKYAAYIRNIKTETELVPSGDSHTVSGITGSDGEVTFNGLPLGDYTITEVVAPDGYNLLNEPINITIDFDENDNLFYLVIDNDDDNRKIIDNGIIVIEVLDQAGIELPGTGGIGTTIFYVAGICLMLGAAVVLITRRRMNHAE